MQKFVFSESLLIFLQDDLNWENYAQSDKRIFKKLAFAIFKQFSVPLHYLLFKVDLYVVSLSKGCSKTGCLIF